MGKHSNTHDDGFSSVSAARSSASQTELRTSERASDGGFVAGKHISRAERAPSNAEDENLYDLPSNSTAGEHNSSSLTRGITSTTPQQRLSSHRHSPSVPCLDLRGVPADHEYALRSFMSDESSDFSLNLMKQNQLSRPSQEGEVSPTRDPRAQYEGPKNPDVTSEANEVTPHEEQNLYLIGNQ
jgi:hypothetical protein